MQPRLRDCALTLPPSLETWVLGSWSAGVSSVRVRALQLLLLLYQLLLLLPILFLSSEVQEEDFGGEGEEKRMKI